MRRQIEVLAPENATIQWTSRSGRPTGFDSNQRPIFENTRHSVRCWLEQRSIDITDDFDSSTLSEFEDVAFIGRIYSDYDESLVLQQKVVVLLDPTERAFPFMLEFDARMVWGGRVAIPGARIRLKQNMGEAITLIGHCRRRLVR